MKNVLLLCVSTVNPMVSESEYQYIDICGTEKFVKGYTTNEAPTKSVIEKLKAKGVALDKIVMLCTDTVSNKKVKLAANKKIEELKNIGLEKYTTTELENLEKITEYNPQRRAATEYFLLDKYTHKDFYVEKIEKYSKECAPELYNDKKIQYVEVAMPDVLEEEQLTKATLEAAGKVIISEEDEDVKLYIDYNGGPRSVAFMLLAISNLMKLRHVQIQEIMYMNFDNKVKKNGEDKEIVPIQNMMPVFESFELVNGIHEYVRYGHIKGLESYFEQTKNDYIKDALLKMKLFAHDLQLCRTSKIEKDIEELNKSFEQYEKYYAEEQKKDVYEYLFFHVLEDIKKEFKDILDGQLPEIIKWCVKKQFVQQALTFCSEELAGYFWNKEIYYAVPEEKKAYRLSKLKGNQQLDSQRAGDWMKSFLIHTENDKKKILSHDQLDSNYKNLIDLWPYGGIWPKKNEKDNSEDNKEKRNAINAALNEKEKNFEEYLDFNLLKTGIYEKGFKKARRDAMVLLYWSEEEHKRANVSLNEKRLGEILTVYCLLRDQRNKTNHASKDSDAWPYDHLCDVMIQLADVLRKVDAE